MIVGGNKGKINVESGLASNGDLEGEVKAERRAAVDELLREISGASEPNDVVLADLVVEVINSEVRVGNTANIDHVILVNDSSGLSKDTGGLELVGVVIKDLPLGDEGSIGDSEKESKNDEKLHFIGELI